MSSDTIRKSGNTHSDTTSASIRSTALKNTMFRTSEKNGRVSCDVSSGPNAPKRSKMIVASMRQARATQIMKALKRPGRLRVSPSMKQTMYSTAAMMFTPGTTPSTTGTASAPESGRKFDVSTELSAEISTSSITPSTTGSTIFATLAIERGEPSAAISAAVPRTTEKNSGVLFE